MSSYGAAASLHDAERRWRFAGAAPGGCSDCRRRAAKQEYQPPPYRDAPHVTVALECTQCVMAVVIARLKPGVNATSVPATARRAGRTRPAMTQRDVDAPACKAVRN